MADGNGRARAWELRMESAAAAYAANGGVHRTGREMTAKSMAVTLGKPAPEMKWLVPDYVPSRTVTLLTGDGGVGKSLLAMQLMTCVAAGRPFLGMEVQRGPVFGLFCEDEDTILHHRQLRMSEALGVADSDLAQFWYLDRGGEDAVMYGPLPEDRYAMDFTQFWFDIHGILRQVRPVLIVLDTVADIYGANENHRPDVRRFIRELRKMSFDYDAAVLACAHPSLSGMTSGKGYSGSTAWHNSVRSRIYLTKPEDATNDDDRLISGKKNNYGPAQGDFKVRYQGGAFVRIDESGTVARIERSVKDRSIMDLIAGEAAKGMWLSSSPNTAGRYLPKVAARAIPGMGFGLAKKIMDDLIADGAIRTEMVDRKLKKTGLIVMES